MRKTFSTGRSMPLRRQHAEAGEVRLVLELERPRQRAFEVHAVPVGQVVLAREARGRVAGVHRAVAVAELRPLAGGAAVGVGLADDDRLVLQLRERRDDARTPSSIVAELVGDAHPHVAVHELGRALGVERDEVDRRADLAGRVVRAAQAVLEEVAHELAAARRRRRGRRPGPSAARGARRRPRSRAACGTPRACRASSRCSARSRPPSTTCSTSARPYCSTQCFAHW